MLQILTGAVRGKKLRVPKGSKVRPTTSRVKKSIFDTLGDISGLKVLDIFAGSGGLGIESLSRSARHVTFVERDPHVFKVLSENVHRCGFKEQVTLYCSDYRRACEKLRKGGKTYELIFIDPPYPLYNKKKVIDVVSEAKGLLEEGGLIVIEHDHKIDDAVEGCERITKPFGGTHVSYFRKQRT